MGQKSNPEKVILISGIFPKPGISPDVRQDTDK